MKTKWRIVIRMPGRNIPHESFVCEEISSGARQLIIIYRRREIGLNENEPIVTLFQSNL